jgi:hypothetical protein
MTHLRIARLFAPAVVGIGLMGLSVDAHATKTYYADEGLHYSGNGSSAPDLVSDIGDMVSEMNSDGYNGLYFTDGGAWPQDFVEACSSQYGGDGLDSSYGDAYAVSIFSGHGGAADVDAGNQGFLYFSYQHDNTCYDCKQEGGVA